MNYRQLLPELAAAVLVASNASAAVHYVNPASASPWPPYSSWSTAATSIQEAVDFANTGDQVMVTNGTYQAGNRMSSDGTTNRVVVTNAITLQSVNGAAVTTIDGGNTSRCIYLANGAVLAGFTLTKGNATNGAGVFCASTNAQVLDCLSISNSGKYGAGAYSGTLSNCTLTGNSVGYSGSGGGAYSSTLLNCIISTNSTLVNGGSGAGASGCLLVNCTIRKNTCNGTGATVGGGVTGSTLYNCSLIGNRAVGAGSLGGGAYQSTLNNCALTNNYADFGGGAASGSALTNCIVNGNSTGYGGGGLEGGVIMNGRLIGNSSGYGGGAWGSTLYNCVLIGNSAGYGGGADGGTLYNCTLYNNGSAVATGGGAYYATLYNSIVYYSRGSDLSACALYNSCAPGLSDNGNISAPPQFVNPAGNDLHLTASSPCINAGTNLYVASIADLDGNLRIVGGTVDMGACEFHYADPLAVSIQANYTNVVVGYPVTFSGVFNGGRSDAWDFGDGTVVSNQWTVSHSWQSLGDYPVTLTVYDDNFPAGVSGVFTVHVIAPPFAYVDPGSTNPVPPFGSWETAATTIQDAVDAVDPGYHVLVTNSVWQTGGRVVYGALTNRLVLNKPVVVESVNGPAVTLIEGSPVIGESAVRCVYLTNGATLSGFTLLNGATRAAGDGSKEQSGGGAWCESTNAVLSNCILVSNAANVYGGGIAGGSLTNCSLLANSTLGSGGAAYAAVLQGCLVSNNTAATSYEGNGGGGASSCTLVSCTIVSNSSGGAVSSTLASCTLIGNTGKDGGGANNSTLRNCTLFGNFSSNEGGGAANSTLLGSMIVSNSGALGGGVSDSLLTNCVLSGNTSQYQGGGASSGTLHNCLLTWNSGGAGGGAANNTYRVGATLINCTLFGNSAVYAGGGVESCTAWNCIIASNTAPNGPNWHHSYGGTLNYCCTTPLPTNGVGHITDAPLFVDPASGVFQLQSNSPCINAGTNLYAPAGLDLAGNPRLIGGTMDLGAYECQSPVLLGCYTWLQNYGLSTYAASLYADADHDGMNNRQEWVAGTDPTNASSVLRVQSAVFTPPGLQLRWNSVTNCAYYVERSTNLFAKPPFALVQTNIPGLTGTTTFTDSDPPPHGPAFYRVGVQQ